MTQQSETTTDIDADVATLSVTNLGGIDTATVEFSPGVTLLTGRNATNRTSLLRALNGALGGTAATLKSTADEGDVTLQLGDEEYTRTYTRTATGISGDGDTYTDADTVVDSFVTLMADNPARRAVERGENLHDVIMRPVDTAAIEQRIRDIQDERESLEARRDHVEEQRDRLPNLENRRESLRAEIEDIDAELEELREEVTNIDADAEDVEDADALVDELDDTRQQLRDTEDEIELVGSELTALEDELEDVRERRADLPDDVADEETDVESELESLRARKRELDNTIASLTTIVEFNDDLLADDSHDLPGVEPDDENVSAALAPDETRDVVCWTCGSRVEQAAISDRLDDLRDVVEEKQAERGDLEEHIAELADERRTLEEQQNRRDELDEQLERTEQKIEERKSRQEDLESTAAELRDQIQELEAAVAETEAIRESDLLETYEQLSDLEYERGQLKKELDEIESEIADIEALPTASDLDAQLEELTADLERERTRIADLESAAVEQFNDHMDDILDVLAFENIARVWIERKTDDGGRGRSETQFELHVVREDEAGTVYEDVVSHLSESEREVVGLVVALAGYLAHETYEAVPFMLLDSLEAIDAERIAELVEYFAEFAPHLVVALLPEDASELPADYERIEAESFAA